MADFTRRTHIVRVKDKGPDVGADPTFVDIEVIDAIAYRTTNGEQHVLSCASKDCVPYIVDETGDGNEKSPGPTEATRRSHMKRIEDPDDPTVGFDIEILDAIAFRDENGKEWILNMPTDDEVSVYNSTTDEGDTKATRRIHNESPTGGPTIERCDSMSFRSVNGEELIIVMPSSDDPNGSTARASSATTPEGYDPKLPDTDTSVAKPPDNKDPNVYVAFTKKKVTTQGTGPLVIDSAPYRVMAGQIAGPTVGAIIFPDEIAFPTDPSFFFRPNGTINIDNEFLLHVSQEGFPGISLTADIAKSIALRGSTDGSISPFSLAGVFGFPFDDPTLFSTEQIIVPGFLNIDTADTKENIAKAIATDQALGYKFHFGDNPPPSTKVITGGLTSGPKVKVNMGPLWWIRKVGGGGNFGGDHPIV